MQEHWVKFFTNNKLSEPPRSAFESNKNVVSVLQLKNLKPRKMNLLGQRHMEGRGWACEC